MFVKRKKDFFVIFFKRHKKNAASLLARRNVVEEDGFEPSKLKATDLQSAPFGHSGTLPYRIVIKSSEIVELAMGLEPATCWLQISCSTNWATPAHNGRGWGIWTPGPMVPNHVRYQTALNPVLLTALVQYNTFLKPVQTEKQGIFHYFVKLNFVFF